MTNNIHCNDATLIPSLDGTMIALHDFGGHGSPILLSHATGFHAHCWEPLAEELSVRHHVVGFDHRGYGDAETVDPATIEWRQYGQDALAAARAMSAQHNGEPLVAFGHSMGGASLLMASLLEPSLFRSLFVFEPIVFPPHDESSGERPPNPLAGGARKRKSSFASFEAALENFTAKPPMASFHPAAREAYVRHGFKKMADGTVELKCLPEHEARTYETGGTHGTWDDLPHITVPTWVIAGAPAPFQPSSIAALVAEQIPNSTYVQFDNMGHFGPLEHPHELAVLIESTLTAQKMKQADDSFDRLLEPLRNNRTAVHVFNVASKFGDFSLIWHVCGLLYAIGSRQRAKEALALSLALGVESLIVNQGIKRLFRRERPTTSGDYRFDVRTPSTSSFPSGHASSATFAAVILTSYTGMPLALLWVVLASVVALSRVVVRIHHFSDIVGGIATGAVLSIPAVVVVTSLLG